MAAVPVMFPEDSARAAADPEGGGAPPAAIRGTFDAQSCAHARD
jgi:hypothetical protein